MEINLFSKCPKLLRSVVLGCAFPIMAASGHSKSVTEMPATLDARRPVEDQRYDKLEAFFRSYGCPAPHYVGEYLGAADANRLDYRLLPAISVLESTCGIYQRVNNRWGWDSARRGFSSFKAGLEYLARELAVDHFYKNKTLDEKVRLYNPRPQYAQAVRRLMRKIEDAPAAISFAGDAPFPGQQADEFAGRAKPGR